MHSDAIRDWVEEHPEIKSKVEERILKKQRGSISIFGKPFEAHRLEILRKVGSLIESPSLYDHPRRTIALRASRRLPD